MCTTSTTTLLERNTKSAEAFTQKMVDSINGAALTLMTSIGHQTGLFDTMSHLEPSTSSEIADEAGLNERYVREWLGAMVTGGVVDYDPVDRTYCLPDAHAAVLTREASPNNLAVTTQWISVLGGVEQQVVDAFKHGKGVPYSAYREFHRVMAEESAQTVVAGLEDHILPLVPGLTGRLRRGIDVLDVACGAGLALITLAQKFPTSWFTGYDISEQAIAAAWAEANRRGLTNVNFVVKDLANMDEEAEFDLVTAFDAIHDQGAPAQVLQNIRTALRPGGLLLMQDILASSHVHENIGSTFGTFTYTISCMHCMSVSLANGGPGLGAAWGKQKAVQMLGDAGFDHVEIETLAHDPINYYYIAPVE